MREYGREVNRNNLSEYTEFSGYGVSVKLDGKVILAGNQTLMKKNAVAFEESENPGTRVYIAVDGVFAGCIVISDELKASSRSAVSSLKTMGVQKTIMLTGDNPQIAAATAGELGIDEAYGGLLPHEKVEKLEYLAGKKKTNGKLAFVGDGINDAPVLARADIGVAMGALGSDAAIEAADVVLMTDDPLKLPELMKIARFTMKIVRQNIFFSLGVKAVFLLLGAFGYASMREAVFADVGVSLLAVLNAVRIIQTRTV
jgi:Cd2+/Zn2+-exporting ATPase